MVRRTLKQNSPSEFCSKFFHQLLKQAGFTDPGYTGNQRNLSLPALSSRPSMIQGTELLGAYDKGAEL